MTQTKKPVITFSKRDGSMAMPHLLDIQTAAFQSLLRTTTPTATGRTCRWNGCSATCSRSATSTGSTTSTSSATSIGEPKYSVEECIERDMTYAAPLKATLQLVVFEEVEGEKRPKNIIEKEVYLGELPIMTPLGTFVINGAERVVVSQLHRSPGRGVRGGHPPERPAALLGADHPVPGLVGRVHDRHSRRDLRPHRQEEEVPGHGAAARLRLRRERGHPAALLRHEGAVARRQDRDPAGEARDAGRAAGRGSAEPRGAEGRPAGRGGRRADPRAGQRDAARGRQEGAHLRRLHHARPPRRREPDVDP